MSDFKDDDKSINKKFSFEVNGEIFISNKERLTVKEILEIAGGEAGVNPQDLDNYYLTDLDKDEKYEDLSKEIRLYVEIKFLATYKGKTPVA